MTREETIHMLEIELKAEVFVRKCFDEPIHNKRIEAFKTAIELLKQPERPNEERPNEVWIKLPCNIGDTVYRIKYDFYYTKSYQIYEWKFTLEMLNDVGHSVFLTREEAEKKIADMRGGRNDI